MPTSTFTPGDEKQDEKLNPGQQDADRRFNGIARAEENGTFDDIAKNYDQTADPSQEDANIDNLRRKEADSSPDNSGAGWKYNVGSGNQNTQKSKVKGWFKKASPVLGTGGVIGIAGLIMIGLASPSLLIVQMKEIFTDKFNTQLSSMEKRSNKLLISKMQNSTKGFCSSTINVRCKYSSMSEKQIAKFKAAGIEVVPGKDSIIPGRTIPESFKFKGQTISPGEFMKTAGSNADFRLALKQAYNPKYAGFVGKAWENVSARFKISKQSPELDAEKSEEEARKKMNQLASEGVDDDVGTTRVTGDDADCEGSNCRGLSGEDANEINSRAEDLENAKKGPAANELRSKLSGLNGGTATSIFKATGILDQSCQVYGALNALSYAAKAIRSAQLVRYAMIYLTMADTIKAGKSPDPADVALLGTVLTTTVKDTANPGKTLFGSATDSFGYKYAAYGDTSGPENSMKLANRFTSGSGFTGSMSQVTSTVLAPLGGRAKARDTCKVLANPFVQGASLILGVAMLFVPGVNVAKASTSIAMGAAVAVAVSILPTLLADIVAGTVTNDIVGEEAGNAITSGSGALLSDALAGQSGNAPMTKEDAIAYNELQTETVNQYIADELRETSPFDATNPHTFVGSIAASLIPLQSSSNPLTVVGSLLSNSISNVIPKSKAISSEDYAKSLEVCQDLDVVESKYAADPFCNTIRGIPPQYLDKEPLDVVNELLSQGAIDEEGTPNETYKAFINKCMTSEKPLGYSEETIGFNPEEASECMINSSNANYYLFYMDQTIDSGFDGEYGGIGEGQPAAEEGDGSLPDGTAAELAQAILSSGKVTDRTGQLQEIASGSRTNVNTGILKALASLATSNTFTISSLKRDQVLSVGAGQASLHLQGMAADISGSAGLNGVSFGYNGHNPTVQAFLNSVAAKLPSGCQIGVPNQAYVNATKPLAKPGCSVFVDTGTAPHIHIGVRGDG